MATSVEDFKLASVAAGFTLGFGLLTVWEAIKQTREIKSPLRSVYIYMVWGEIAANLLIGIIAWLFLDGTLSPGVPLFFSILFLWVFEIQLLMQIIINRLAVVVDNRRLMRNVKWGTAGIITLVNIAVFIIWIPAHLSPPPIPVFVNINVYWDRTSKVIICIVDAGLNYYFLRTVKKRLVKYHGLTKYAPLVSFNAKLMAVSIAMDIMLIGLMSLPNQVVYVQFHPVAYMVKLNIEMSMASLIKQLARDSVDDRNRIHHIESMNNNTYTKNSTALGPLPPPSSSMMLKSGNHASAVAKSPFAFAGAEGNNNNGGRLDKAFEGSGIHTTTEVLVKVENVSPSIDGDSASEMGGGGGGFDDVFDRRPHHGGGGVGVAMGGKVGRGTSSDDELPLSPQEGGGGGLKRS